MNLNINIYAIIVLILSAILGFGGGVIARLITDDDKRQTNIKIALKGAALIGMVAALIISIYL